MSSAISCPAAKPMPTARGSWPRSSRSWPACWTKIPRLPDLHQFRALWQRAAERAGAEGRHLLLVVDGLDEDLRPPGLPSVAALLPAAAGGRAHVLVSSRPHPELPADIPAGHPLRHARPVLVEPFSGAQELAVLARQEIDDLLRRDDDGLAADVLGLLTAAAGPLAVRDLAAMTVAAPQSAALARRIRRLVTTSAARSLQTAGLAGGDRYQFAHESLLAYAQADDDLNDPDFRRRIHQWAERWRAAGWPAPAGGEKGTPRYLLDTYPATLTQDPQRLAQLASDIGWVEAAIASAGVDAVLADLRRAAAANPASTVVAAVLAAVTGQAHNLRPPQPVDQPGYILRQLWMQAAELAEDDLADDIRSRLQSRPGPGLVPRWTTRRASRALSGELGRHDGAVRAVAVLADGRVVTGGDDGRVLVWDPADPGAGPAELGRHDEPVRAVAVLPDGRVVTGGRRRAGAGVGPGRSRRRPGRAGPPRRLGGGGGGAGRTGGWSPAGATSGCWCGTRPIPAPARPSWAATTAGAGGGGAARRAGGHRRGRRAGAGVGPGRSRRRPGRAGPPRRPGEGGGGAGRTGGWSPAGTTGGCWCGTRPIPAPARPSWAATTARCGRWRCWPTGGWSPAGTTGGCWCGTRPIPAPARPSWAATTAGCGRWRCWPDGRVVTGGSDQRVLVWDPAHPGAGPAELGRHDGWVQAVAVLADGRVVTGGTRRAGAGVGPGRIPAPARPSWAATTAGCGRWRCWPDGRVVTGGDDGRVLVWDPAHPGAGPAELGRHDGGASGGGAGRRAGGHRRERRAGAGVGPGPSRRRPGRAGPPRQRGAGGGGAAGRAGGHRRVRRAGAGVGPGRSRRRPGRAGPPRRPGAGGGGAGRTGGWSPAGTTGGCWCGTRPIPAPARPSWAATTARCGRWRCWPTGGWSPAGTTGGCWCGTRPPGTPSFS